MGTQSKLSDRKSVLLQNIYLQFVTITVGKNFSPKTYFLAITDHHLCTIRASDISIKSVHLHKFQGLRRYHRHPQACPFAPLFGQKNILIADGCRSGLHARAELRPSFCQRSGQRIWGCFESQSSEVNHKLLISGHEQTVVGSPTAAVSRELTVDVMTEFLSLRSVEITSLGHSSVPSRRLSWRLLKLRNGVADNVASWVSSLLSFFPQVQFYKSIELLRRDVKRTYCGGFCSRAGLVMAGGARARKEKRSAMSCCTNLAKFYMTESARAMNYSLFSSLGATPRPVY